MGVPLQDGPIPIRGGRKEGQEDLQKEEAGLEEKEAVPHQCLF